MANYASIHVKSNEPLTARVRDGDQFHSLEVSQHEGYDLRWQMQVFFETDEDRQAFLKQCAALLPKEEAPSGPSE